MSSIPIVNGDLVSGIARMAAVGTKLTTALLSYTGEVANADKSMADFAGDVAATSHVLSSVGNFLAEKDNSLIPTQQALKDANIILDHCHETFTEIKSMVEKKVQSDKDGKSRYGKRARFMWPAKSSKAEQLKKRLESLKTSLLLLLHVLSLGKEREKRYVCNSICTRIYTNAKSESLNQSQFRKGSKLSVV